MKNKFILIITMLLLITFVQRDFAQDARITQAYSNPLRVNPATMGSNNDLKFILNYRNQWSSINNGYITSSVTGICPLFLNNGKSKLDIGLSAMSDKAGAFVTSDGGLALDYNLKITQQNYITLALMAGFIQKSLNINNQTFDNQYVLGSYDPKNPTGEALFNRTETHPDLGFGLMWFLNPDINTNSLNAYAGLSAYHLNKPNGTLLSGNSPLPVKYSGQAGIKVLGENKVDLTPNFRLTVQNGNSEIAAGLMIDYSFTERMKFVVGGWYRVHDATAILIGFEHKNFTLGYSYDMVNTTLRTIAPMPNAHELSLSIRVSRLSKSKNISNPANEENGVSTLRTSPLGSF